MKTILMIFSILLALYGCNVNNDKKKQSVENTETTSIKNKNPMEEYVQIPIECTVIHSGYEGIVVSRGLSKPTGTLVELQCNGKIIETLNNKITDGFIDTKNFGKVAVRFYSMIATIGAKDFAAVPEGGKVPEKVLEFYVHKSKQEEFDSIILK